MFVRSAGWKGGRSSAVLIAHVGGKTSRELSKLCIASPICLRLLIHCARRAASRADCTAGNKQGDQYGDDGDDDKELDQRKSM